MESYQEKKLRPNKSKGSIYSPERRNKSKSLSPSPQRRTTSGMSPSPSKKKIKTSYRSHLNGQYYPLGVEINE